MKENLLSLYNQFGSPLLESFVGKTTRKRPTEIIDDLDSEVFAYVPDEDILRRFVINNGKRVESRIRLEFPFDVDFGDKSLDTHYDVKGVGLETWESIYADDEFFSVNDTNVYATWLCSDWRMETNVYKNFYTELTKDQQREIMASLNANRRMEGLPPLKSPKDFLSESMVRKITSKKKTDILNDNDFQMFDDFKSMNRYIEEKSGSYGIESFKEENDFSNKRYWGYYKTLFSSDIKEYCYTDKFGNTVGLWIADTNGYIEEECLEDDYSETGVPDGILLEMWINSGEDTTKYMIIDPDFKNIECQMLPYKFISYKDINMRFMDKLMRFIKSFEDYFRANYNETSILERNGQEIEPSSSNLDNLLTTEMFPEISRNV